jgi:hypothetical protein
MWFFARWVLQQFLHFFSYRFWTRHDSSSARRISSTIVSSAIHLNKTCASSTIHWRRCDSQQGEFLHQVSQFLQLSILNKTWFFFSKKGFFYNSFLGYPFEQDMGFFNYPFNKMWFSARRVSTPGFSISSAIHFEQDVMSEQQGFFLLQFYERSYETWKGRKFNKVSWTQIATLPTELFFFFTFGWSV